jgi:hypothetical protein
LLVAALVWACNASPPITALTDHDCPEGASVVGAAPPAGFLQRCELPGGVRHGKSRAWYDNGRLRYETEWWQGVKHGTFTLWYANGQKRAEGQDRHGAADGKWTSWNEDGTLAQEQVFHAPERVVPAETTGIVVSAPTRPRRSSPAR